MLVLVIERTIYKELKSMFCHVKNRINEYCSENLLLLFLEVSTQFRLWHKLSN